MLHDKFKLSFHITHDALQLRKVWEENYVKQKEEIKERFDDALIDEINQVCLCFDINTTTISR